MRSMTSVPTSVITDASTNTTGWPRFVPGQPAADPEIHWVMTAAWTFAESAWRRRYLTPITRWAFARLVRVYGFVPMPPMPPDPDEVEARAAAVLRTLRLARQIAPLGGVVGLAPEGQDIPGEFGQMSAGVGTFVALLAQA